MIKLPKQLKNPEFRFIKISTKSKTPIEADWTTVSNYSFDDKHFISYLNKAKSYGILTGVGNLIVIDCDKEELANKVQLKLPTTFTIKTGCETENHYHFYYIVNDYQKKIILEKDNEHQGEIQALGQQVVGPGSIHISGNKYTIIHNKNIKEISWIDILKVLDEYIHDTKEFESNDSEETLEWDISSLVKDCGDLQETHDGIFQGPHPIHGSETGKNFQIDINKNTWHCFRCNSGGDTLSLIAVLNELVLCNQCKKGFWKHNKQIFKEAKKLGVANYNYKDNINLKYNLLKKYQVYYWEDKKKKLSYMNLAKLILNEHGNFLLVTDKSTKNKDIYYYKNGYYQNIGERIVRRLVSYYIGKKTTKTIKTEVLDAINDMETIERSELEPSKYLINVNNGVLDIRTMELQPHSPSYTFLNKIPIDYIPNAKCDKIKQFFKEVLTQQGYLPMQELFGYCLYREYPIHSVFIFRGTGRNGKGVTLSLLQLLLGFENISARKFHEIVHDQHARADLYCKYATLAGEMRYGDIKDNAAIKELSGEDVITARRLYKESFEFTNYAKLIFATNNLPPSVDMNIGWLERIVFFEFPHTFLTGEKKTNPQLIDELRKEKEGLLIWAIEGLKRLLKQGCFSNQEIPDKKGELWETYVNTVQEWADNRLDFMDYIEPDAYIKTDKIYKDYCSFCSERFLSSESKVSFIRKLCKLNNDGISPMIKVKKINGESKKVILGVILKNK